MFIRLRASKYRIEIVLGKAGQWFWRVVSAANGQTIVTSETYSSRARCAQTAEAVAKDSGWPIREEDERG